MGMIPEWQLPSGVDRGLWDYLHSRDMAAGYDEQMAASPLAAADVRFCEKHFQPGRLLDLGCGTGRLCRHFASRGFDCTGVDLSEEMLALARQHGESVTWLNANIVELADLADASFENVACLFSTLGMARSAEHRRAAIANAFRLLKPGGTCVLHVHNRSFRGLGWRRFRSGDITMPQAYGGAALTIHHFSRREIAMLLQKAGFAIREVAEVRAENGATPAARWRPAWNIYGYLIAAARP